MDGERNYKRVWFQDLRVYTTEDNRTFVIPIEMRFNDGHMISLIFYSVLIFISGIGNLCVLSILLKRMRHSRSRINMLLVHLAIADLLVTFILMPMEVVWAATVSWWFGDLACRVAAFFRSFGLYQSCFVLVCIGIDRYYAVLKPMKLSAARKRGKIIVTFAWIASAVCSIPQMIIFHVERHPNVTWYEQCITFNSFPSKQYEFAYSFFGMLSMYIIPLFLITFFYGSILHEICNRCKDLPSNTDKLRRNNLVFFGKAKIRTLKMTITIISAFFICWTPYYVMALWYWIDMESAKQVDLRIQRALFLFACTNSSINPIVYGVFNIRKTKTVSRTKGSNTCTTEIKLQQLGTQ